MLDKLLDTESICWRDPSFFSEEALLQRALPYLDLLVNDLWAAQTIAPDRGMLKNLALVCDLRSMPGWNMAQWQDGFVALQNLHRFWERNAAEGAFDENPDMWTSWLFAFTFFEIVEAKRGDVERAFQQNLLYLSN
jgi:hypothetical protein